MYQKKSEAETARGCKVALVHWVPLIWAAFLQTKSDHISRVVQDHHFFDLYEKIKIIGKE